MKQSSFDGLALERPVKRLKRIAGFLLVLLVTTPGEGGGPGEFPLAYAHWHRVFGRLPELERSLHEGKPLEASVLRKIEGELEALRVQEGSNPFFPLAQGMLRAVRKEGTARLAFAEASALAGRDVGVRLLLWRAFLHLGQQEAADQELKTIRGLRDQLGLHRLRPVSEYLSSIAKGSVARPDLFGVDEALALAEEFDPDAPEVHFARAQVLLARRSPHFLGALGKGWWLTLTSPLASPGHWAHLLSNLLLVLPLGLLLVGLTLLLRTAPLLAHDLTEATRRRIPQDLQGVLSYALFLLPLILGLGLLPATLFSLLLLGVYLRRRERLLLGLLIISLTLLPWGYRVAATLLTTAISPRRLALQRIEEGNGSANVEAVLLRWAQEQPHDYLPRFALGRLYRYRGELVKANAAYNEATALAPLEAAVWTNRGNLAFLTGDLKEAKAAYGKAVSLDPDLPQPRFNLGQLLTEELQLEQAEREYAVAIQRMPHLKERLRRAVTEGGGRILPDAPLPAREMWRRLVFHDALSSQMAELLWAGRFLGVPLTWVPWLAGGYLAIFLGATQFRQRRRHARACARCGKIFCGLCQRLLGETRFCSRCALLERARGEGPPSRPEGLPLEGEAEKAPRWFDRLLIFVPGVGGVWRGRTLSGSLLLGLSLIIASPLLGRLLDSDMRLPGKSLPYEGPASLVLLGLLYLLTSCLSLLHRRRRAGGERWR